MAALSAIVAIMSSVLVLCETQQILNNVNITTGLGTVTGLHVLNGNIEYFSFRGIPYANAKRFKAPTSIQPWKSVVMATNDGPQCPQPSMFGESLAQSEDCLFLNVYTPQLPHSSSSTLPVMVYIHGGAFLVGSSNSYLYGPEFFMAEKNVVLVTFNYRLGIFGFLSTGTDDAQGNAGLKDQVEALKFVKYQISYFGGDPERVTIFGESAGAASVVHQILSPMSKGLFKRGIAQSGSALADWAYTDANTARNHATIVARNLGCNTENSTVLVTCLKAMSISALCQASVNNITAQEIIKQQSSRPDQLVGFRPVIEAHTSSEEVFLADHTVNVLDNLTKVVPLIIGTCKDEGASFLPDDDSGFAVIDRNLQNFAPREVMEQATADQLNAFGKEVRQYYFDNGPVNQSTLKGVVDCYFSDDGTYVPKCVIVCTKKSQDGYCRTPFSSTDEVIKNIQWPEITNASQLNYLEMEVNFTSAKDYYKDRIALWDRLTTLQKSSAFNTKPTIFLTLFLLVSTTISFLFHV